MQALKKIFTVFTIGTFLLLSLIIIILSYIKNDNLHDTLNNKINSNKVIYKDLVSSLLFDLNEENIKITLKSLFDDKDIRKIELIDFTNTIKLKLEKFNYETKFKQTIQLYDSNNEENIGTLNIVYTHDNITNDLKEYIYDLITISTIFGILSFIIMGYFISNITNSLVQLNEATQEIAEGNLSNEIIAKGNNEITSIANNLNTMRASLEKKLNSINSQLEFQNTLINTVNVAIYVKDKNKKYVTVNDKFIEFIGLQKEKILGSRLDELVNNKYSHDSNISDSKVLNGEIESFYKTNMYNNKKELKKIISFKTPLIKNGKVEGIIGSIYDESNVANLIDN